MEEKTNNGLAQFKRMGGLSWRKLKEYIPAMFLTNLSTLLLLSVDGIMAGNLVGADALSSINISYPVSILLGAITAIASIGISTSISNAMGKNDKEELDRVKGVSLRLMIYTAVFASIVQFPLTVMIIRSYGLPEEIYAMTMQYAVGVLLCTPFGVVSAVGTYQLMIAGKMKMLVRLAAIEGFTNLFFDMFFMGVMHIGVAGAGFGTLCANIVRATTTVIYIYRNTDLYKSSVKRVKLSELIQMARIGIPDASYILASALQGYLIMKVILAAFGTPGGVIRGVTSLCFSICNVVISSISGSMRPLMGIYSGAGDKVGLRILMRQGHYLTTVGVGIITLIFELRPQWFYAINGIHDIPEGGIMSIRLFVLFLILAGYNSLLRLYLVNRKDTRFTTALTLLSNVTLPLFAFLLWKSLPTPFIFLSYMLSELVTLVLSTIRYIKWVKEDMEESRENGEDIVLYMTVVPEEAVEASRRIRTFEDEHGIDRRIAYRVALCMEEMVAYVRERETTGLRARLNAGGRASALLKERIQNAGELQSLSDLIEDYAARLSVEVVVRFTGKKSAIFVSMDDGECIALDKNEEESKLITNNYELLRKLASSVEYQYILEMNYTRITFEA